MRIILGIARVVVLAICHPMDFGRGVIAFLRWKKD